MAPPTPQHALKMAGQAAPELSPEVRKLRARFLTAIGQLAPEAGLAALRERLQGETREMYRLGNLAAQTWLVRQRFVAVMAGTLPPTVADMIEGTASAPGTGATTSRTAEPHPAAPMGETAPRDAGHAQDDGEAPKDRPNSDTTPWQRLRILSETEVHGVRFFAGTNVDVGPEDAARLIAAGSAEAVTEEPAPPKRRKGAASVKSGGRKKSGAKTEQATASAPSAKD